MLILRKRIKIISCILVSLVTMLYFLYAFGGIQLKEEFTGKKMQYRFTSGGEFPENLTETELVIHCGGCMLNEREMKSRISHSKESNVPITNYGIAIAMMNGILKRSVEPFDEIAKILEN